MSGSHLTQTVLDAFNALADEVQELNDRRIVLEHKLHFAHEQFQSLADKYAPAAPDIAKTLAQLQPPPYHSIDDTSPVPLLKRGLGLSQHEVALIIRDGRRAANKLASLGEVRKTTLSTGGGTLSQVSLVETSMPTTLEQDFTVEGRKGRLQCPFSRGVSVDDAAGATEAQPDIRRSSPAPHASAESHCAPLPEDSAFVNGAQQASKCPIRFIDERSPEEIAQYVEAHKHSLPRSHELCLRRYQRNEEQIKKLDSKYGNIVSMIEDLSQLHKPMLPEEGHAFPHSIGTRASHERVETWAQEVDASAGHQEANPETPKKTGSTPPPLVDEEGDDGDEDGRQGRSDRPLKEVRVGESPSRPWGISVPFHESFDDSLGLPISPPPAPVRMMPISARLSQPSSVKPEAKKCPFDHTKFSSFADIHTPSEHHTNGRTAPYTSHISQESSPLRPHSTQAQDARGTVPRPTSHVQSQPVFINSEASKMAPNGPQMIFTGPVFIGYPMEQAIQLMNQTQRHQ